MLTDLINLIVIVIGFIVTNLIKKTPDHILDRKLEKFKNELQQDLEKLRIATENIHPKKIEEYINFTKIILKTMELAKVKHLGKENLKEIYDGMMKFGFSVLLFGSDETIKKYVEYRKYATLPQSELGENEKAKMLLLLSELIILMRKDLGNTNSNVTTDDFMMILVNNWEESKEDFKLKALNAKKL